MRSYDQGVGVTVVFEPAEQTYRAQLYSVDQNSTQSLGGPTVYPGNDNASQTLSGAPAYYAVLTPSGAAKAISGVSTFSTEVTFTMGVMLTVFHD